MFKKFILGFLSVVLLVQLSLPLTSKASTLQESEENLTTIEGMGNEYSEEQSMQILESISIMDNYIGNKGDKLFLDPKAKKVVEPFVYEHFNRGIKEINQQVQEGTISLDTSNRSVNAVQNASVDDGSFSTMSFTNTYWWGLKWYLSKSESTYWQNRFNDYSFGWGTISAIAGTVGAPVASVAAVIMAAGNYYLARELRDNTSSTGSVLVFKWAPPSAYAYKR